MKNLYILGTSLILSLISCSTLTLDVIDDVTPINPQKENNLPSPGSTESPVGDPDIKDALILNKSEYTVELTPSEERWCGPRGVKELKIKVTEKYLHGYIVIDENLVGYEKDSEGKLKINLSSLSTFAVWIDADGISEGQGGGWFNSAWKGYECVIKGDACTNGVPLAEWAPFYRYFLAGGDNFGMIDDKILDPGYGKGVLEDNILTFYFVVSKARTGLDKVTSAHINVTFNLNDGMDERCVIASRSGYQINTKAM